jgi:hypothetical protein
MTNLLEQLVFNDFATKDFEKAKGNLKFTLKTLSGEEQLELEKFMRDIKGTPKEIMHTYSLRLLCYALVKFQNKDFTKKSKEEIYSFLQKRNTNTLDLLLDSNKAFARECKALLNGEEFEDFSQTPSTQEDSDSSQEE